PSDSYAARRAPAILHDAQRVLDALNRLLAPDPANPRDTIDLYVADACPSEPDCLPTPSGFGGEGIVVTVQPEAPEVPIAAPLTRRWLARWFGADVASTRLFVEGIAGLVAARTRVGPLVEEADRWVQTQIDAGRPVSIAASPTTNKTASTG